MKVISVINQKGGVGKTQSSINLAVGLSKKGNKVLLIDADAQGNTTSYFSKETNILDFKKIIEHDFSACSDGLEELNNLLGQSFYPKDINNLLLGDVATIQDCIYPTQYVNLSIIPSTSTELIRTDQLIKVSNMLQHSRLKKALRAIKKEYDYVIIDNAPTFNTITLNTLFCANEIIIPVKLGRFELEGLIATVNELKNMSQNYECDFSISILINMLPRGVRPQYTAFIQILQELVGIHDENIKIKVLNQSIGYQEAAASKSSLSTQLLIESKTRVADDFINLTNEINNTER